MPKIPSNWEMVTIADIASICADTTTKEPSRSQKRKPHPSVDAEDAAGRGKRVRPDSSQWALDTAAGRVGGVGSSGRGRGTAAAVAAATAAAAIAADHAPPHEPTVAVHDKQSIIDGVVNAHADTKYRNEIRSTIESSGVSAADRETQIQSMVSQVTKNMHNIIEMTDYKSVLQGVSTKKIIYTSDIRSVPKAYEDTYLRQPVAAGERECVRGMHCECMCIDASQPFVGVEYLLPWEGAKDTGNGMCLPCIRAATQALFYDILHSGLKISGLVQKFYNEHSREGEYRLSAMLFCPPSGPVQNLPMPVMRHQRNFYKVSTKNNVHFMEQVGVDFQSAPCM